MEEKIINILQDLHPEYDFSKNVNFISEGMLDSFDIVSLVSELEDNFNITIDGVEIRPENFSSVKSISDLIKHSESNK